jgi:hypothetical protein
MSHYFSERELGVKPRTEEIISFAAWGGIFTEVQSLIKKGAFGGKYPILCEDGGHIIGNDIYSLHHAVNAQMFDIDLSKKIDAENIPKTFSILDFIEFCYLIVAKPEEYGHHIFFDHKHLAFDKEKGECEFREEINRIFSRNGLAYELKDNGKIERLAPPILHESLVSAYFDTGDEALDKMLEDSRIKFLNVNPKIRREAVERLWDCWERLKTLEDGDKKKSIETLLSKAAQCNDEFKKQLNDEATALTKIGNSFHIRHSEKNQCHLTDSAHFDYLFHRLFSMVQLLLSKRNSSK